MTHYRFVFSGEFQHFVFYFLEVAFFNHLTVREHHVIEEAVFDSGTEAELYAWIELLQCLGEQVCACMPETVFALFVLELIECDACIILYWAVEFHCLAIDAAGYNAACESWRDALCDLLSGNTFFVFAYATVWKCYFYHYYLCLCRCHTNDKG